MQKFSFQLDAPLKFRKNHRDLCRRLFAQVLSEVASWRIDGQRLELRNGSGAVVAAFEAAYLP